MNAIARRLAGTFENKVQAWARRRQGIDPPSVRLASRRIYILPTRAGLIFAGVVFTMLLGSMNYNNNMGFALTFLLAGIGIISIYHCHRNLADVCVHFAGSHPVFNGETARFSFVIENTSSHVREQLQFGSGPRPDRCDQLLPGARQTVIERVATSRRGWLHLPRLSVSCRYPLGLFRAWTWIDMDLTEIVYPQPAPAASMSATGGTGLTTTGRRTSGDDDFSGLRHYRIGDPPKRIAWKVLARTGEMLITEYDGASDSPVWIDWQAFAPADSEQRLSLMARRVVDADTAGQPWGLRLPGQTLGPQRGAVHRHACLAALALFDEAGQV